MDSTSFFSAVLARLRAVRHSDLPDVAERSGVPKSTLLKIRYGEVKNPGVQTVQALHDYFAALDSAVPEPADDGSVDAWPPGGATSPIACGKEGPWPRRKSGEA